MNVIWINYLQLTYFNLIINDVYDLSSSALFDFLCPPLTIPQILKEAKNAFGIWIPFVTGDALILDLYRHNPDAAVPYLVRDAETVKI